MLKKLTTIFILFSIAMVFSHHLNAMENQKETAETLKGILNIALSNIKKNDRILMEAKSYADKILLQEDDFFEFTRYVFAQTITVITENHEHKESMLTYLNDILKFLCEKYPELPFLASSKVEGYSEPKVSPGLSLMHYAFLQYYKYQQSKWSKESLDEIKKPIQTLVSYWDKGDYSDTQKNYTTVFNSTRTVKNCFHSGTETADQLAQNLKISGVFWKQPPRLHDRNLASLCISLKLLMWGAIPSITTSLLSKTKSQKWWHIPAVGFSGLLIYRNIANHHKEVEHLYPNNTNPFKGKTLGLTLKSLATSYGLPGLLIEGGRYLKNSNFSGIKNRWRQYFKA